jgi:arginyl-tRNA synthetase
VKLLPQAHAELVQQAIEGAQKAGKLPEFDIPEIPITIPKNEEHGDYACPIALGLAKLAKMKPRDIADIIVAYLPEASFLDSTNIAGPGFINFRLSEAYLKAQVSQILEAGENYFSLDLGAGRKAQVEFVSANPSGPITIGRSRGGIVGDTMARLLDAAGFDVQREYYFNNAGMQMVMLGESLKVRYLQALGQDAELPENGYQGDYLIDFAKELAEQEGDKLVDADWKPFKEFAEAKMFEWIRRSLKAVNIEHDNFFNEDSLFQDDTVWDTLKIIDENGYLYKAKEWEGASDEEKAKAENREPATWFRTTAFGDDKDRVMVKSDGIPTYTLPDIAYHKNKIDRGFDIMVNVLGADHGQQYKVVQDGLRALNYDPSGVHVIINQMVRAVRENPETGELEEVKMSTRRGVYDTLDDLVEATSPDAIRYHMLARSPSSHLNFNLDEVVKQSNENPVYYIQNAHVRCAGILREAEARGISDESADVSLLGEDELRFIRKVLEMGEVIETAVSQYEPHKIAFYAQQLAGVFHPLYDNVRAIGEGIDEDVTKARLHFYRAAKVAFKRVLELMGMNAPEYM